MILDVVALALATCFRPIAGFADATEGLTEGAEEDDEEVEDESEELSDSDSEVDDSASESDDESLLVSVMLGGCTKGLARLNTGGFRAVGGGSVGACLSLLRGGSSSNEN